MSSEFFPKKNYYKALNPKINPIFLKYCLNSLEDYNRRVLEGDDDFSTYLNRAELHLMLCDYPQAKDDLNQAEKLIQNEANQVAFNAINCRYEAATFTPVNNRSSFCVR